VGRFGSVLLTGFLAGPSTAAPVGLALGLPAWATVLAVSAGAWASFVIALFAMESLRHVRRPLRFLRHTYTARLVRRLRRPRDADRDAERRAARLAKARRVLTRFGPAGFGLVGPALFGTWVSAVVGSALGLARQRLLAWLVVGATVWSALLVLASHTVLGWLFT